MQLEKGYIYHIYNQGNNKRQLFFNRENYLFFQKKIDTYISPYAAIIAWCLMPNHFHLMVLINEDEIIIKSDTMTSKSDTMTSSHRITKRIINNSIAIMLRSYTRAINKQQNTSGSLFKAHTKAECVNCQKGLTPSFLMKNGITNINYLPSEIQYPQVCFNYIHKNPVKAGLVKNAVDWEFSSAADYANLRNGILVNKEVAASYIDINSD